MNRFFGYLLMTVGGLWLALTGACTAVFMVMTAVEGPTGPLIMLAVGAIPMGLGLIPFLVGRLVVRRSRQSE